MKFLALATAVLAVTGCQADTKNIEKKLDDQAKDIRDIKAMIAKGGGGAGANVQQQRPGREEAAPDAVFAVDISPNIKVGMVEGPVDAPVTIVEAWDLACPYCQRVSSTVQQLVQQYQGKVRVVFKNLVVHPQIVSKAHLAGCAAAKQGKFVEFYHAWWDKAFKPYAEKRDQSQLGEDAFMQWIPSLGLDAAKFKADMEGQECAQLVAADAAELRKFRVGSTPSFFIGGHYMAGAMDASAFKELLDKELKNVEASGVPAGQYYDKVIVGKGEKQFRAAGAPKPN